MKKFVVSAILLALVGCNDASQSPSNSQTTAPATKAEAKPAEAPPAPSQPANEPADTADTKTPQPTDDKADKADKPDDKADTKADQKSDDKGEPALDIKAGQKRYEATCKMCHDQGLLDAPKLSDKAAWQARVAKGKDTLYQHSTKGFNKMPAQVQGDVTEAEVKAAVDYMLTKVS